MNTENFTGKAEAYAKYRPSYPNSVYEYILTECGLPQKPVFADIGAGTGIFSLPLLKAGYKVYCVEPNVDMKRRLDENTSAFENCVTLSSAAENTALKDAAVDCIAVAQAFHWFDRQAFKSECRRVLRENGIVVLLWNSRVEDELLIRLEKANERHCPKFKGFSGGVRRCDAAQFDDFFSERCNLLFFDNDLYYEGADAFAGRCLSGSYALKPDDIGYEAYVKELREIYAEFESDGRLKMKNRVEMYVGKA